MRHNRVEELEAARLGPLDPSGTNAATGSAKALDDAVALSPPAPFFRFTGSKTRRVFGSLIAPPDDRPLARLGSRGLKRLLRRPGRVTTQIQGAQMTSNERIGRRGRRLSGPGRSVGTGQMGDPPAQRRAAYSTAIISIVARDHQEAAARLERHLAEGESVSEQTQITTVTFLGENGSRSLLTQLVAESRSGDGGIWQTR